VERAREAEAGLAASTAIHLVGGPPFALTRPEGALARGRRVSKHGRWRVARRAKGLRNGARRVARGCELARRVRSRTRPSRGGFERSTHQEPNIQWVLDFESRLQGSSRRIASYRRACSGERSFAGTLVRHERWCETRRTWRRCPGWTASRCQVTRCVAEWVR
jgi:hypothetical protein